MIVILIHRLQHLLDPNTMSKTEIVRFSSGGRRRSKRWLQRLPLPLPSPTHTWPPPRNFHPDNWCGSMHCHRGLQTADPPPSQEVNANKFHSRQPTWLQSLRSQILDCWPHPLMGIAHAAIPVPHPPASNRSNRRVCQPSPPPRKCQPARMVWPARSSGPRICDRRFVPRAPHRQQRAKRACRDKNIPGSRSCDDACARSRRRCWIRTAGSTPSET